jgi:ubiquinone/menaquinone biosynthesis C-methylase UbiE
MNYSPELAASYSQRREQYNETDNLLFDKLEDVGVQDKIVLDVGCGDGRHAEEIKEMGAAQVIGLDRSEDLINIAKRRLNEQPNGSEGLAYLVATGEALPIESESVDRVISNFVGHYFPDATVFFAEIARVLKNEGYSVCTLNITNVEKGYEHLYNTPMPIRLGTNDQAIVVQNLIKSRLEIEEALERASLRIIDEIELDHPNAIVDQAYPNKDHIEKHAVLLILKKEIEE